ncbi:NAD-dependent succinate-semialdehyde dehydrogenase [Puniceicoccales bacterium CK1056]|uniref:NAD-dependent succinate-semialdehyde dehydrogenase n=1 Tax=Oceanipulchritudo coccoides TaxID=2706888 RepID=A0A6B2M524_9BACT|nr:NAD-dependent succinate-semialdehyde dehydrogenase [Oceanipulchritudo coccoides]NDV63466.1 NAD-dependent succinate-semialdehyde dehydrogenase [Oceanipulchritudo coccoides]
MVKSVNPATEGLIREYPSMDFGQVGEILNKTTSTAQEWAQVSCNKRAQFAHQAAEVLESRLDEFALLITREMGKPVSQSRAEIEKCAWVCRYFAENAPTFLQDESVPSDAALSYVAYQPLGVVLAVMPWNFPFWQVFRFAAPGLTAGNGAILKHASNVSGCALAIEDVFREAGYPENLFRTIITGPEEIQQAIQSDDIQAVTLTGSEAAGSAVAAAAGKAIKKSVLELGGSDPYIILEDADLDLAAEKCAQSRLLNSGQSCIAAKRFIVLDSVREAFTEKLISRMTTRLMGDPEEPDTDLGPLARADLRDDLHKQVTSSVAAGARLLMGGQIPDRPGYFYPPTVLDEVKPGMPAYEEETFGPVAAIIAASDAEEALNIANDSEFGLGAAIFSKDTKKARSIASRIKAGSCFINDFVKSDPRLPFGGIRKSGYGRELAKLGIREFTNIQTVVVG